MTMSNLSMRNPVHLLAFGLGSGLSPFAPGTMGTIAGLILYLPLAMLAWPWYLGIVLTAFLFGIYLCGKTSADLGVHDHGGIVWDEFVGYWLTMLWIPFDWVWIVAGFVLFRLFDIVKPWPIGWLDKKLGGGLGIMLDDVIAGLLACGCLHLAIYLLNSGII